jgi:peptidoglycan/LPS O-acetylase OafA/YrhL
MKASSASFQAAVLFVLVGMLWGIKMAISNDHSPFPAHAHLNLLGWVSLFLFGIYYRLNPTLDRSRHALIQVAIWCGGTIVMVVGVGLLTTGHDAGEPIAAVGSLIVLAGMADFGWLVYQQERQSSRSEKTAMAPAE